MADPAEEVTARNRWLVINMLRIAGVIAVVFGLLLANRSVAGPQALGYVLIALGLLDAFLVPQWLARKWRSPDG